MCIIDMVSALIVADIAPVTYKPRHDVVLEGLSQVDLSRVKSRKDADGMLSEHVEMLPVRQFLLKNLQRLPAEEQDSSGAVFRWRLNLPVIQACYSNLAAAPEGDGPYEGPTLFIKGEESPYIQEKHRDKVLALFPAVDMKVIQGTGHWLHAEKADTFATLCRRFLEDAEA